LRRFNVVIAKDDDVSTALREAAQVHSAVTCTIDPHANKRFQCSFGFAIRRCQSLPHCVGTKTRFKSPPFGRHTTLFLGQVRDVESQRGGDTIQHDDARIALPQLHAAQIGLVNLRQVGKLFLRDALGHVASSCATLRGGVVRGDAARRDASTAAVLHRWSAASSARNARPDSRRQTRRRVRRQTTGRIEKPPD
jgi:hypothetical protein